MRFPPKDPAMSLEFSVSRRGALAIAGAGLLSACVKGSAKKLVIGDQRGGVQALLAASGELKTVPYAIEWAQFPNAAPLIEALAAGAIDTGVGGDAPFIFSLQGNAGVKAIAAFRTKGNPTTVMVPGTSAIHSFDDLLGKRVATPRGSIGHYLLLAGLKRAGKPLDAIHITFLSPSDGRAALTSGSVDAWAIWDPYAAIGELSDGLRILDLDRSLTPGLGFVFGTETSLATKRPLLTDLSARFARARKWGETHREEYAQMLTQQTGVPIAATRRYLNRSVNVPVPIDAGLIAEEQGIADLFHQAGLLAKPVLVAPHFEQI
ncbi:ABC transporter substrate-binding protein [Sphingomonas glacialis]|uniref:Putative aliphatic sulfonates-binding protein n=2 Tax=Sphingomonas glacialis TaxID=658225 RepID=A0A502FYN3_9SPHN|nr:ABC transporter substrate-binding protein [Sphingomonas glacialis]